MIPHNAEAATLAFIALFVAHFAGDYLAQTDHMATHKAGPGLRGWLANAAHVGAHLAAMLATLAVARLALGFTTGTWPTAAALAWAAGTHGLIDRRRVITWWMTRTGSSGFLERGGAPLVDQAAHIVVGLFPAAVLIGAAA
ncbi:DUF3307 domain-containing protein [Kitasatospora sp. NPDC088346]|uniref:DUF3307 domain-containing protein n=1 Tax=Kitasatospora sp. NPDC088346 TaxID=3364073 RepID=UPI0038146625